MVLRSGLIVLCFAILFGCGDVDERKVNTAKALVNEYERCLKAEKDAGCRIDAERAHLKGFAVFDELRCIYASLNDSELRLFFDLIAHHAKRKYFEQFIRYAYSEIDYMSAFSIPPEEHNTILASYRKELKEQGLSCYEPYD
jgi:hypothetical protein